jgi:hypothetical protein
MARKTVWQTSGSRPGGSHPKGGSGRPIRADGGVLAGWQRWPFPSLVVPVAPAPLVIFSDIFRLLSGGPAVHDDWRKKKKLIKTKNLIINSNRSNG